MFACLFEALYTISVASSPIIMNAVVCTKYGPPEGLVLKQVPMPVPKADEVRIKIYATSVTASDALLRKMGGGMGERLVLQLVFGFGRPRNPILGMTLSGVVESVGSKVTKFAPNDEVFAYGSMSAMKRRFGSYAEYQCLPEEWNLLSKPENLSHKQAAALPYGAFLAFHCVKGRIQPAQRVLIYGASGSIGTMAVQLAKAAGAVVTGVCSARNFELVRGLGCDRTIDYTSEDAVKQLEKYDLVVDAVGNSKTSVLKKATKGAIASGGKYVSIDDNVPATRKEDFVKLRDMAAAGTLTPVIDRSFRLEEMVEAHRYVSQGHKRGNVVISVVDE